jgi:branched-chain amino acid transport system permease protein
MFFNGLMIGAIYALIGIGYVILIKAMDLINIAQGEMVMIGAFIGYYVYVLFKLPFVIAFIAAVILTGFFGICLERIFYRNMRQPTLMNLIVATIAVSILIRNGSMLVVGSDSLVFPPIFGSEPIRVAGLNLIPQHLFVLVMCVLLMVFLQIFFYRTKVGIALRAVMFDPETAKLMGINVQRSISIAFGISAGIGGAAGVLIAPLTYVVFDMGAIGIKAFGAAVLGGLYSIPGAVVGGLLLGLIDNYTAAYVSSAYRDVIALSILILVLLIRPEGILGGRAEK